MYTNIHNEHKASEMNTNWHSNRVVENAFKNCVFFKLVMFNSNVITAI